MYLSSFGKSAAARWCKTVKWRRAKAVDTALTEPQKHFADMKRMYPHFLHGRTREGEVVMYELLGCIDLEPLKAGNVAIEDVFRHFVFVHEHISAAFEGEETRLVPTPRPHLIYMSILGVDPGRARAVLVGVGPVHAQASRGGV